MDSVWRGIFKSYRVVEIIPTYRMSKEDWELLDWEDLRNTAKNRIVNTLGPDFLGFVKINIFEKGKSKPNYLWPVTVSKAEEIAAGGEPEFGNEIDEELETPTKDFEINRGLIEWLISLYGLLVVWKFLIKWCKQHIANEKRQKCLEELNAQWDSGLEDLSAADASLAICITITNHSSNEALGQLTAEAENSVEDDAPEEDEGEDSEG